MSLFYSPLRYPGGKNCIYPFISKLINENSSNDLNYVEPYAGGAGLALRLLMQGKVGKVFINDFDRSIYAFWDTIINKNDLFCEWVESVEVNVANWHKYKSLQNNAQNLDNLELAKSTFFLNRTNISGIIKGGMIGGLKQNGKYKLNARFNKKDLIKRITRIYKYREQISVSNLDGIDFINKIDNENDNLFIYLDPPYYKKGSNLYMNFYKEDDHIRLASFVKEIKNKWIVSYDYHCFIKILYKDKNKISYSISQCTSNRVGTEIIIFSDEIKFKESIGYLNSPALL